jgi:hypothetical protein
MKDYYRVLGVPRNASAAQIKRAYRHLIKGCHPDVNSSPQAADWTRELNEAYGVVSEAQARMSYDLALRAQESDARASQPTPAATAEGRGGEEVRPGSESPLGCERCGAVDSSLRVSAIWRVRSFITYSTRTPATEILCGRCRVRESLSASAYTVCLGWWGLWGFFWTLDALWANAWGGEQPKESNAALLNALAWQLEREGRGQEAYEAVFAAFTLKPDAPTKEALEKLRQYEGMARPKPFWSAFWSLELHPVCYHALAGAALVILVCLANGALNGGARSHYPRTPPGAGSTNSVTPGR